MEIDLHVIQEIAREHTETSPLNRVAELDDLIISGNPLVGVADASDPLFEDLKKEEVVGVFHRSPQEWLEGAHSVIAYFLPFTPRVREANRVPGLPATEWLYGRIEGELINRSLGEYLVKFLINAGYRALSPCRDQRYTVRDRRSNWSERHVAFIAGLGTFSLSRSLITRCGSAGRIGSVVTDLLLRPTPQRVFFHR